MDLKTFNLLQIKCNDIIKVEVFIYKQTIELDGIYNGLVQSDVSIQIGLSGKNTLIPISEIKRISPILYDAKNKLNAELNTCWNTSRFIQCQIFLQVKTATNENVLEKLSLIRTHDKDKEIRFIIQQVNNLIKLPDLSKLLNFDLYKTSVRYENKITNISDNLKKSLPKELSQELQNNVNIDRNLIKHIQELILLYLEIKIELSKSKKLVSVYLKIKRLYIQILCLMILNLNSQKPICYTDDIRINYLKSFQFVLYLKQVYHTIFNNNCFQDIYLDYKSEQYNIFENLQRRICIYHYIISFYMNVYNAVKEMTSYDTNNFFHLIFQQLYKLFYASIPNDKLNYSEKEDSSSNREFSIPLFIKKDISIKNLLQSIFVSGYEINAITVKIRCPVLAEKILNYAEKQAGSGNLFSLDENLHYLYNKNKEPYYSALQLCFSIYKNSLFGDFSNLSTLSSQLLNIYRNSDFLFTSKRYQDDVIKFLTRINIISNRKTSFSEFEKHLLLTNDYCANLIDTTPDELLSIVINTTLSYLNKISHSSAFLRLSYRRYSPEVQMFISTEYISFNTDKRIVYIPLTIHLNRTSQPIIINSLNIKSDNQTNTFSHTFIGKNNNNSEKYELLKIPYEILNFKDSPFPERKITLSLSYSYKVSFDISNNEPIISNDTIEEDYVIPSSNTGSFTTIDNIFSNYKNGGEVQDRTMFFGRDDFISKIIKSMTDQNGRLISSRCILLHGQTRTGKSSLVYHIKNELVSNNSNIIIVDMDDIGTISDFETGFKSSFLSTLIDTIQIDHEDLCDYLEDHKFNLDLNLNEFQQNSNLYFNNFLHRLNLLIKKSQLDKQILLIIDEFTYIYDWINHNELDSNFMKFFHGMIHNFNISSIMIGQDHTQKFINDQRFTRYFTSILPYEVNYLSKNETSNLISTPVSRARNEDSFCNFSDTCLSYLFSLTSGSPYITMNLCSDFIDYLNDIKSNNATINHVCDFLNSYLPSINEIIFEPLYCEKLECDSALSILRNKRILSEIARKSDYENFALIDNLSLDNNDKQHIFNLRDRNVIELSNEKCRIKVYLYSLWLKMINRNFYEN